MPNMLSKITGQGCKHLPHMIFQRNHRNKIVASEGLFFDGEKKQRCPLEIRTSPCGQDALLQMEEQVRTFQGVVDQRLQEKILKMDGWIWTG